ncbi:MAG: hypothetical protein IPN76_21350 [Saprospiraceae bacterium]|nr:hypothetical protein [Saprospiraceae bacterium]
MRNLILIREIENSYKSGCFVGKPHSAETLQEVNTITFQIVCALHFNEQS